MNGITSQGICRRIVIMGFIALCAAACSYTQQKGQNGDPSIRQQVGTPSYAQVLSQVFKPSCGTTGCHTEFNDYGKAFAARAEIQQKVFVEHSMPKEGVLSTAQLSLLKAWLDGGAPQNAAPQPGGSSGPGPSPSTGPSPDAGDFPQATWANVQSRFFTPYCLKCHSGAHAAYDLDLTDLTQVRDNLDDILDEVRSGDMPPARTGLKVASEDHALLLLWSDNGMPGPDGRSAPHPSASPTP